MLSSTCAARAGALSRSLAGLIARRRLQQARDDGAFVEVELGRRFAEIATRRRVDAIGAGAEIDPVQVDFEDLVLAEAALQPQRQQSRGSCGARLRSGVRNRFLASCWVIVLPPCTTWPARRSVDRGAHQTDRVDAEMAVEAAVLGGDHRLRQKGRHFLQRQRLAEQIAEGGERAAVFGQDRDARPPLGGGQLAGVGQGQREIGERDAADNRAPQGHEQRQPEQAAEPVVRLGRRRAGPDAGRGRPIPAAEPRTRSEGSARSPNSAIGPHRAHAYYP